MASRVAVDAQPDKPTTAVTIRIPVTRPYRVVLILFSRLLEYVVQDLVDHLARRHARKRGVIRLTARQRIVVPGIADRDRQLEQVDRNVPPPPVDVGDDCRSEEHTSELQS